MALRLVEVNLKAAEPRAMAGLWGDARDWPVHEVTDEHARLRSATGRGPYLEFRRAPDVGQGAVPWRCLTDPEGNEFCVLTPY